MSFRDGQGVWPGETGKTSKFGSPSVQSPCSNLQSCNPGTISPLIVELMRGEHTPDEITQRR